MQQDSATLGPDTLPSRPSHHNARLPTEPEPRVELRSGLWQEERRLLYVAMTRARERLFVSYVSTAAGGQLAQASRFLKALPPPLVQRVQHWDMHPDGHFNGSVARWSGRGCGGSVTSLMTPCTSLDELPSGSLGERLQSWRDASHAEREKRDQRSAKKRAQATKSKQQTVVATSEAAAPIMVDAPPAKRITKVRRIVEDEDDDFA